jgi:hypothetical protein
VTKVNDDGTYNVKYILGGSDKSVHPAFMETPEESKRQPVPNVPADLDKDLEKTSEEQKAQPLAKAAAHSHSSGAGKATADPKLKSKTATPQLLDMQGQDSSAPLVSTPTQRRSPRLPATGSDEKPAGGKELVRRSGRGSSEEVESNNGSGDLVSTGSSKKHEERRSRSKGNGSPNSGSVLTGELDRNTNVGTTCVRTR